MMRMLIAGLAIALIGCSTKTYEKIENLSESELQEELGLFAVSPEEYGKTLIEHSPCLSRPLDNQNLLTILSSLEIGSTTMDKVVRHASLNDKGLKKSRERGVIHMVYSFMIGPENSFSEYTWSQGYIYLGRPRYNQIIKGNYFGFSVTSHPDRFTIVGVLFFEEGLLTKVMVPSGYKKPTIWLCDQQ